MSPNLVAIKSHVQQLFLHNFPCFIAPDPIYYFYLHQISNKQVFTKVKVDEAKLQIYCLYSALSAFYSPSVAADTSSHFRLILIQGWELFIAQKWRIPQNLPPQLKAHPVPNMQICLFTALRCVACAFSEFFIPSNVWSLYKKISLVPVKRWSGRRLSSHA